MARYYRKHREQPSRKAWTKRNPRKMRGLCKEYHRRLRTEALAKLGGKCVNCGFSDERALQIDHVNGGGVQELRRLHYYAYLQKVIADRKGLYQLLCANCNWIKRVEERE